MRIARLRWWHIAQIVPIEADLFGAERWSAAMFWNELASGQHYLVALGDDDTVIGYAGLAAGLSGESWVQNIAVRRDAQRQGIGRALLEALLAEAARRGSGRVLLEVAADNVAAQKLYTEYSFEVVGMRPGYYQPSDTDALVMRRDG